MLDDEKVNGDIVYPFIFINASLEEGYHTLQLVTKQKTYKIEFKVDFSPILVIMANTKLYKNGTFYLSIANIDTENRSVYLNKIIVRVENSESTNYINKTLGLYNRTYAAVDLNRELKSGVFYILNTSLIYFIEGKEEEYKIKMEGVVSY